MSLHLPAGPSNPRSPNPQKSKALKPLKPLSRVQKRSVETSASVALEIPGQIVYQHSVLCQTSIPYRDPGAEVRTWEREQGAVFLRLEAGHARHPKTQKWVPIGLPFGPKPRLILAHLNAEALKTSSPKIDIEDSFTAFVRRIQNYRPNGYQIRAFKTHLGSLAASIIRIAMRTDRRDFQVDSKIVTAFDLWFPKDESQRVLWPSTIHLSLDYFASLQNHAVPLDERALAGLAHSAMALDLYAWLAQRLHRIPRRQPQFVAWATLKEQFGAGISQMCHFKHYFRVALGQVLTFYPAAKVEGDGRGLTLYNSAPPVKKRLVLVDKSQE